MFSAVACNEKKRGGRAREQTNERNLVRANGVFCASWCAYLARLVLAADGDHCSLQKLHYSALACKTRKNCNCSFQRCGGRPETVSQCFLRMNCRNRLVPHGGLQTLRCNGKAWENCLALDVTRSKRTERGCCIRDVVGAWVAMSAAALPRSVLRTRFDLWNPGL